MLKGTEVKSDVFGDLGRDDFIKLGSWSSKFESIISITSSSTSGITVGVTGIEEHSPADDDEDEQVDDRLPWPKDGVLER